MPSLPTLAVISINGGVPFCIMALLASKGAFDRVLDCAIIAGTHLKPPSVHNRLEWFEGQMRFPQYVVDYVDSPREDVKAPHEPLGLPQLRRHHRYLEG